MDFCKGRIPPNALQIHLEAPQILPLWIVSGLTPALILFSVVLGVIVLVLGVVFCWHRYQQ